MDGHDWIGLDIGCFGVLFFAFVGYSGYERKEKEIYQRERYQIGFSFCGVLAYLQRVDGLLSVN